VPGTTSQCHDMQEIKWPAACCHEACVLGQSLGTGHLSAGFRRVEGGGIGGAGDRS
jgi:hypothetical protein